MVNFRPVRFWKPDRSASLRIGYAGGPEDLIKAMNTLKKKEEAAAPPAPNPQEVLLAEIRDLLKKKA